MNILPQKSWHVRTRKNIERVRRDEAKAAEEEKERQRKIALAEQEARTDLLRKRAKTRDSSDQLELSPNKIPKVCASEGTDRQLAERESEKNSLTDTYTGHINFFKDAEAGEVKSGKNAEHEEEKKAEKEKFEKDIGLLTYLGQSAVESKEKPPWYLSGRKRDKETLDFEEKDRKLKASLDPLNQMESYLHKKKHKHKNKDKEKHHKHKKSKEKESKTHGKHSTATLTIEQLRAERLNRERQERQRALDLLSGSQGRETKAVEEPVNEREQGYNSAFNPEFSRKPKHRHPYEERY